MAVLESLRSQRFVRSLFLLDRQGELTTVLDYDSWVGPFVRFRLNILLILALGATATAVPLNLALIPDRRELVLGLCAAFFVLHGSLFALNRSRASIRIPAPVLMLSVIVALEAYGFVFALLEPAYAAGLMLQLVLFALVLPAYLSIHIINFLIVLVAAVVAVVATPPVDNWETFTLFILAWGGVSVLVAVSFLERMQRSLLEERSTTERLLADVLPDSVIEELKRSGRVVPRRFDGVAVLFADIVGFTTLTATLEPEVLLNELSEVFGRFDDAVANTGCQRIKTIGDAYLAEYGMDSADASVGPILEASIAILDELAVHNERYGRGWQIRVGVHVGPVVGGIVGHRRYVYDIFGDTVNVASRLQDAAPAMCVNVSEAVVEAAKGTHTFVDRGVFDVKGKGQMRMFLLEVPVDPSAVANQEDSEG